MGLSWEKKKKEERKKVLQVCWKKAAMLNLWEWQNEGLSLLIWNFSRKIDQVGEFGAGT